ncbi:helix-turn-helix domain-containing protein [Pontibacter sp. E15-1]|uniref:helix-turn-helix domain-containing protein n=1 Tax=Pontibacter sp. E15-1 TaxID=2919918 RepID=UPI001F4F7931|nr:helix-turn-helix domain-containing protein [Pontibacter sp. E15-1]MCJ8165472.1 helix-turn-helix domain-containing protein [Pontibacter sp. E15-1]
MPKRETNLAKLYTGRLKEVTIVPKLGISPKEVADTLSLSKDTVMRNIHRDPSDPLYLPAFRVNERDYRIYYEDLIDFIRRNYVGTDIRFSK